MKVVVGLGSNLGDRLVTLRSAVAALGKLGAVRAKSAIYETAALLAPGASSQPHFFNAAVLLETELAPDALLDQLHAIEAQHGRVRGEKWAARTLDLDILWIDGMTIATEKLVVPHPQLRERAFALRPLLDVAPGAKDPATRTIYRLATGNTVVKMNHEL